MGMPIITPSRTTRCQAITDIVESVALEQAALSHILNAEGEKLQKIVSMTTSPEQMLAVNRSVQQMVNEISKLEMVLQSKLSLFDECLCSCGGFCADLQLVITANEVDGNDSITHIGNDYTVVLFPGYPRTVLFSGLPVGTAAETMAVGVLPPWVTLVDNLLVIKENKAGTDLRLRVVLTKGDCSETFSVHLKA